MIQGTRRFGKNRSERPAHTGFNRTKAPHRPDLLQSIWLSIFPVTRIYCAAVVALGIEGRNLSAVDLSMVTSVVPADTKSTVPV